MLLLAVMLFGLCPAILAQESFVFPIEGERVRVTFVQGEELRQTAADTSWNALPISTLVQAGELNMTKKGAP